MTQSGATFQCNICASIQPRPETFDREAVSCANCGSNIRTRGLMYVLSMELFALPLAVPDFPRVKSLRGLGTSDENLYAQSLAQHFDYRNTFFDREPRFDLTNPAAEDRSRYDFIVSSDVFEHVTPPVENAFRNVFQMLKPGGVLLMTVPYSIEPETLEHYPELHQFGFAQVAGELVLVNRTKSGELQIFEKPVFHWAGGQKSLEARQFTEADLCATMRRAGFSDVRIYTEHYAPFGIEYAETWSLPIAARKGDFSFRADSARDVLEQWRDLRAKHVAQMDRLSKSYWFRIGRKLGFY